MELICYFRLSLSCCYHHGPLFAALWPPVGKRADLLALLCVMLSCVFCHLTMHYPESMFCCTLLFVHSSIAIILMWKRELITLLNLSSWCPVMVERLFLAVPRGCLQFVIVVFPDHTHLLFLVLNCIDS